MANIIDLILRMRGTKEAEKDLKGFNKVLSGVPKLLGALGIAIGAREVIQFGAQAAEAARKLKDARQALISLVGSTQEYNKVIETARQVTKGQVSEIEAAQASLILLKSGIADTAEENAKLFRSGQALVSAYEAQGARFDLLIRLLNSGNQILLDNFNITNEQVNAMKAQIEATTNLSGQEARLQAIKQIVIQEGEKLATTISEETIAANQLSAATTDLTAALGDSLAPAIGQVNSSLVEGIQALTDYVKFINEGGDAINSASKRAALYERILTGSIGATQDYGQALNATSVEAETMAAAQARLNEAMGASEEATGAQSDRLQGLAGAYRTNAQLVQQLADQERARERSLQGARTPPGLIQQRDELEEMGKAFEASQKAAEESARATAQAFKSGADQLRNVIESVVQPTLGEVFDVSQSADEQRIDENARRLATVATSGFGSEWLQQLSQQFAGQDFFQPIVEAMQTGDDTALRQAASDILANQVTQLWDVELIKQRVRQQLQQQRLREQIINEVQQELGAQGIEASVGFVAAAAGDATTATREVQTAAADLGTTVQDSFTSVVESGGEVITVLDEISRRLGTIDNQVEGIAQGFTDIRDAGNGIIPGTGVGGPPAGNGTAAQLGPPSRN